MKNHLLLTIVMLCTVVQGTWAQNRSEGTESELRSRTENRAPKLYKDGYWNTICLPFDVSIAGSPLDGATVMELDTEKEYNGHKTGFNVGTGTLYLFFKNATSIEAGKPYIIKWGSTEDPKGTEGTGVNAPIFFDSFVEATSRAPRSDPSSVTSEDGHVTFCGTFAPVTVGPDNTILYIGDQNQLYWPDGEMTINAFRAYFKLNNITGDDIGQASMFTGDDNEATGISLTPDPSPTGEGSGYWYDLQGRKIANSQKPKAKGLYIVNGRKTVIK